MHSKARSTTNEGTAGSARASIAVPLYPWDVDEDAVFADRVAALGVDRVAIAAVYHAVTAITPHGSGSRLHHEPTSAVYLDGIDSLPRGGGSFVEAARRLRERGLPVDAWIVVGHLDGARPDLKRVTAATGDVLPHAPCLTDPVVGDEMARLVAAVVDRAEADGLLLEGLSWQRFAHGSIHDKTAGADMSGAVRDLLALCFCARCRALYAASGVDAADAARRVRAGILGGAADADEVLAQWAEPVRDARRASQTAFAERILDAAHRAGADSDTTIAVGPGEGENLPGGDAILVDCWGPVETGLANLAGAPDAAGRRVRAHVDVCGADLVTADRLADTWSALLRSADDLLVYHPGLAAPARLDAVEVAIAHVRTTTRPE